MMKKLSIFCLILALAVSFWTPSFAKAKKIQTQQEIRELQTRFYQTSNTQEVFKATINTLQDEGFVIINAEDEVGYIHAKKELKERNTDKKRVVLQSLNLTGRSAFTVLTFGLGIWAVRDPVLRLKNELQDKTVVLDANANIEPFGKETKVRLVVIKKVLENADGYSYKKSAPRRVIKIHNPKIYQEFFTKLDKSIFYEKI